MYFSIMDDLNVVRLDQETGRLSYVRSRRKRIECIDAWPLS